MAPTDKSCPIRQQWCMKKAGPISSECIYSFQPTAQKWELLNKKVWTYLWIGYQNLSTLFLKGKRGVCVEGSLVNGHHNKAHHRN